MTPDTRDESLETCYRHRDRPTGLHCTRCGRPVCPDCMTPAPVGHHCPTCIAEAKGDMAKVQRVEWASPFSSRVTPVVGLLIALNVAAFLFQQFDEDVNRRFADNRVLVENGEYYRMLTATFLHANLLHLAMNMYTLWIAGSQVEPALGRLRFIFLYLVSGLGGSALFLLLGSPNAFSLGASGAVFGVFGALWVLARRHGLDPRPITTLIVINLLIGAVSPQIDNYGHIGGLVAGGAVAWLYQQADRLPRRAQWALVALAAGVIATVIAVLVWRREPGLDGRIAFVGYGTNDTVDIFVMSASGGSPRRLTDGRCNESAPAWAPSGTELLFVRSCGDDEDSGIFRMGPDGSDVTTVFSDPQFRVVDSPAWSPDGARIAFVRCTNEGCQLAAVNPDGTGVTSLAGDASVQSSVSWSPDGSRLAFGNDEKVVVLDVATSTTQPLAGIEGRSPAWSPDGTRIAYVRGPDESPAVYTASIDGTQPRRLTDDADTYVTPPVTWSPDGSRLAFARQPLTGGPPEIWSVRPDGSGLRRVSDVLAVSPAWQPRH